VFVSPRRASNSLTKQLNFQDNDPMIEEFTAGTEFTERKVLLI
jgi:hypothetical protein